MSEPVLERPSDARHAEFRAFIRDYRDAGEDRYDAIGDDFAAYWQRLADDSAGRNLPPQHVPQDTYWLVKDGRILGCVRLRHGIHAQLWLWGCHIGYDIRPSERRKGHGSMILRLALGKARELGLKEVFLTCNAANVASIGVICNNGGELDEEYFLDRVGHLVRRYRIKL